MDFKLTKIPAIISGRDLFYAGFGGRMHACAHGIFHGTDVKSVNYDLQYAINAIDNARLFCNTPQGRTIGVICGGNQ